MNRSLTALFAALEALLVVGIGIAIPLLPLTVLWVTQYGLQVDWLVFWRAAVDIWLLGFGVDVTMTLNPVIATALAFPAAGTPFLISIAPLGFGLLTVLLGARAGRRIGEIRFRVLGLAVAIIVFELAALGVAFSALWATARVSLWQCLFLPTLVFLIGLAVGLALSHRAELPLVPKKTLSWLNWQPRMNPLVRSIAASALRGGAAAAALTVAVSAIILAILFVGNYAKIIALYEGIHAGILGGISVTLGQLALLPNLVIWVASWLVGPGFALGTGSTVSPLGTTLGPLPAIPILGALPSGQSQWGFLGLLIPVLAGFAAALMIRPRLVRGLPERNRAAWLVLAGVLVGIAGGVLMGLIAWASSGAAGPGRLVDVGPQPVLVAAWAALEIGLAAVIGLLAGRPADKSAGAPE